MQLITDTVFRVLDSETTGFELEQHAIVEVGLCDTWFVASPLGGGTWTRGAAYAWLCDPGKPIPAEARAVHGITDNMVKGKPSARDVITREWPPFDTSTVLAAHHAAFDRPFFERDGLPPARWLCTYRLAMHVWPDAPSFKNEALRYWLGYDRLPWEDEEGRLASSRAHGAAHDARVTSLVLGRALEAVSGEPFYVDALIAWAESPVVLKGKVGFGKHFDLTWAELAEQDAGYLEWMLRQERNEPGSWDIDKVHTAQHYLGRLL